MECFRRALTISHNNPDVLLNLARMLLNLRYGVMILRAVIGSVNLFNPGSLLINLVNQSNDKARHSISIRSTGSIRQSFYSVNQSGGLPGQFISWSTWSINQSVHPVNHSVNLPGQSISWSTWSMNQSVYSVNLSFGLPGQLISWFTRSIIHSIYRVNQSVGLLGQWIDQSTRSINQSVYSANQSVSLLS